MSSLRFDLHAASVLAPGLTSLADLRAACRGGCSLAVAAPLELPSPTALPSNERRRASQVVRLTLACIEKVLLSSTFPVEAMRSVFATDEGTGEVCQQMLEVLATTRQVSPLLFPNSVLNAPCGYFSIAWKNHQSATIASLGLESFAAGLLCAVTESMASRQPVLLVAYDSAMIAPMDEVLPIVEPLATAWILTAGMATDDAPALGAFAIDLGAGGEAKASPLPSWLPPQWAGYSSARALAALGLLECAPETAFRLTLGGVHLGLRRLKGARA